MPDGETDLNLHVATRLADIGQSEWDACAGEANPFVGYAFLSALEDSGCIGPDTGWAAHHLVVQNHKGRVMGCAPAYLKGHSMGEYVFDWGWAEGYERAGGSYYPKLLGAAPFTPATGPRLLARRDLDDPTQAFVHRVLAGSLAELTRTMGLSSAHVNFHLERECDALLEAGFLPRTGLQYHWQNNNFETFDDFLGELSSRKRKAIRKERRAVAEDPDITIEHLTGSDIRPEHLDAMYAFYQDTGRRKWGRPYLNRAAFELMGERLGERLLLIMAKRGDAPHGARYIAGAMNLIGDDALYGRYWGCAEDVPFLHFELCYHQAIEAAIARGLKRVEAGAQGEHKIARGYLPVFTRSAHYIADPGFRDAVAHFLDRERAAMGHEFDALMEESPYRQPSPS